MDVREAGADIKLLQWDADCAHVPQREPGSVTGGPAGGALPSRPAEESLLPGKQTCLHAEGSWHGALVGWLCPALACWRACLSVCGVGVAVPCRGAGL